jgi:hypothetical protein
MDFLMRRYRMDKKMGTCRFPKCKRYKDCDIYRDCPGYVPPKPSLSPAKDVRGKVAPEDSSLWKCNWLNCLHGCGLAGNGSCSADGEWNNPKCPQFRRYECPECMAELKKQLEG